MHYSPTPDASDPGRGRRAPAFTERALNAGVAVMAVEFVIWLLTVLNPFTGGLLYEGGIESWNFLDLPSLVSAPFIHVASWHTASNAVPFLVLGFLVALSGLMRFVSVFAITALSSGIAAFVLNPPGVNTMGLSGVVFGLTTYLLARGFYSRHWGDFLLGTFVLFVYGSVLWGVLPTNPAVSWQGHLGGAIGGVLAARWLTRRRVHFPWSQAPAS